MDLCVSDGKANEMTEGAAASPRKTRGRPAGKKEVLLSCFNSPVSTPVYDTYWKFATERQEIFFRRIEKPTAGIWTDDPILAHHKFTNAYRASDRVSQYLIRDVIGFEERNAADTFFRILLFKLFNKIDTWELLERNLGELSWESYEFQAYDRILSDALARQKKIYSAAYIMPSGKSRFGFDRKHQNHLALMEWFMEQRFPDRIVQAGSLKQIFETLSSAPGLGGFLAFQYTIDLNYSSLVNFSENDFVVAGPGALNGLAKCFRDADQYAPDDLIKYVTDNQNDEFAKRGLNFRDLWGRALHLIDCQNLFCETDKYARVKHPEYSSASGRTRIKQIFKPTLLEPISYMYPSKWKLDIPQMQAEGNGRLF